MFLGLCLKHRGVVKMEMLHVVLWLIYPYTIMVIIGMSLVWQYDIAKVLEDADVNLKTSQALRKAITSLLCLSSITGIAVLFSSSMPNDPEHLFDWLLSLLQFHPDLSVIMNISILSQVHLFLVLTLLLLLSFTKYISYLFIPHHIIKFQLEKKITKL
jgi:nitrate reductase gamma subunit